MNKKAIAAFSLCAAMALSMPSAMAQTETRREAPASRFQEFRKKMLNDYNDYRSRVLDNYAKFLEGTWTEYASFKGEESDEVPKPKVVPVMPETPSEPPKPVELPKPTLPDLPVSSPSLDATTVPDPVIEIAAPEPARESSDPFDFYGIEMQLPQMEIKLMNSLRDKYDYSDQWRSLDSQGFASSLVPAFASVKSKYGFNDYLLFDFVMKYAKSKFPRVSASSRAAFVHYIMSHLGYDVRLGTTDSGVTMLMLPLKQNVYARSFMMIDGKRYYVFTDDEHTQADIGGYINTCKLPSDAELGKEFDLRIPSGLNIPFKPHEFNVEFGGMTLKGTVNANLMPLLYHYPQMPMGDYAVSNLMPDLRKDLVAQVKAQLDGLSLEEAVNDLLHFIQMGFEYATDEEQHGFEKPYFLEETLFYPKCDCEDRSILYSYLLWNALGVENHIINYPGHESVALRLDAIPTGDCYKYDGKRYLISDPTFLGSSTGQSMPQYKSTVPVIDHIYSKK